MAKRRKNGQMSDSELETRRHHASLRRLKVYCSDMNVELKDYKSADPDDMCILSLDDVDLGSRKNYLTVDNDSWFVSEDDYDEISQTALYL